VLNLDDPFGAQLAKRVEARGVRTIGYSLAGKSASEFIAAGRLDGGKTEIRSTWGSAEITIPQLGSFNAANALGVLGCLVAKGIAFEEAAGLLGALPQVAGRMEQVGDRPLVVIDYAHTPDALDKVLAALKPVAQARGGRLVAVFGAGGGRDKAKRPLMGSAAAARADRVVLTSDNPRGEDPRAIVEAIREGIGNTGGDCVIELDRAKAIDDAVESADGADVVLIAGKGHEGFQEIAGRRLPFSDAAVARAAMRRRGDG
jgi:UDP-N-acetylmuramoyl-L-alanyl-D-glutamate--2,6-diaminopimelate ligase